MNPNECPELELLFQGLAEGVREAQEHVESCPDCAAIVEAHRQLEKDLLRIADPLPPPDFVHRVMAKVEAQPVPLRRELSTGLFILAAAIAGVIALVFTDAATAGAFGTRVAEIAVSARELAIAFGRVANTLWDASGVQLVATASLCLFFALFAARRFIGAPAASKVSA